MAEPVGGSEESDGFCGAVGGCGGLAECFEGVDGDQPQAVPDRESERLVPVILAAMDQSGDGVGHRLSADASLAQRLGGAEREGGFAAIDGVACGDPRAQPGWDGAMLEWFAAEQVADVLGCVDELL